MRPQRLIEVGRKVFIAVEVDRVLEFEVVALDLGGRVRQRRRLERFFQVRRQNRVQVESAFFERVLRHVRDRSKPQTDFRKFRFVLRKVLKRDQNGRRGQQTRPRVTELVVRRRQDQTGFGSPSQLFEAAFDSAEDVLEAETRQNVVEKVKRSYRRQLPLKFIKYQQFPVLKQISIFSW